MMREWMHRYVAIVTQPQRGRTIFLVWAWHVGYTIQRLQAGCHICVQAPTESDGTMARLLREGHVHGILSEDSDLLLYQCSNVRAVGRRQRHRLGGSVI